MEYFFQLVHFNREILWITYNKIMLSKINQIDQTINTFREKIKLFVKVINRNFNLNSILEILPILPVFRNVLDFNNFYKK
jgi:hypothetical protein